MTAVEIKVISSQAIKEAYLAFAPEFERLSGKALNTTWNGTNDILKKLRAGEVFDMAILVTTAMEAMIAEGKVVADSRVDLVQSGIAIGVPAGVPKPDIGSVEAVKRALLAAKKGVGYSSGPSGVFLEDLFRRWGIAERITIRQTPPGTPVGTLLARGEIDIGFQQVSELLLFPGIQYVGPVPQEMQCISVFTGGVHTAARQPAAARAFIAFIRSPAARTYITATGMEQL
ncbi:MAG: substrate-binding domain-containing protein [Hyphomicrobiales bacterium]|nr:substrate-binding domain-containing protein [Hyphomicrobiales bacterium]